MVQIESHDIQRIALAPECSKRTIPNALYLHSPECRYSAFGIVRLLHSDDVTNARGLFWRFHWHFGFGSALKGGKGEGKLYKTDTARLLVHIGPNNGLCTRLATWIYRTRSCGPRCGISRGSSRHRPLFGPICTRRVRYLPTALHKLFICLKLPQTLNKKVFF